MEYRRTRNDLLKLKRMKVIVLYGESVLKKKTVLLTTTLMQSLSVYRKNIDASNLLMKGAMEQIDFAVSFDGVQGILSASNLITTGYSLDTKLDNLIGTFVPSFFMKNLVIKRGYGRLSTSLRIEKASEIFAGLLSKLVDSANLYIKVKRLSEAILRTRARYNSLEKKLLPSLIKQKENIMEFLQSSEQQENFNVRGLLLNSVQ